MVTIFRELERSDDTCDCEHNSLALACQDTPHADLFVTASCGQVVAVRVEVDRFYVGKMPREDSDGQVVLHSPKLGCPVVGAGSEVVAERRELHLPDWEVVPLVDHKESSL